MSPSRSLCLIGRRNSGVTLRRDVLTAVQPYIKLQKSRGNPRKTPRNTKICSFMYSTPRKHPTKPGTPQRTRIRRVNIFEQQWQIVREKADAAAIATGRKPEEVRILPVSKTFPVEDITAAIRAGATEFGENRPQELAAKAQALGFCTYLNGQLETTVNAPTALAAADPANPAPTQTPRWIQIGNLQRNKAKLIALYAAQFQALDSLRLAQTLSRHLEETGHDLQVYLEVNTSSESVKHGVDPAEALPLAEAVLELPRLHLQGFMTVAARLDLVGEAEVRRSFATLRELRDRARDTLEPHITELSMGMSADYELAITEGATCVRLGSALFGQRSYPA